MKLAGEQPDLGGPMKFMVEFQAAITCRHGHTIAPTCGQGCKRPNWLDSLVRPQPENNAAAPPRTVGHVVQEFLDAGKIQSIEVVERWMDGVKRKERRRHFAKFAAIAGLSVAAAVLLYEGGRLIYRVWIDRQAE